MNSNPSYRENAASLAPAARRQAGTRLATGFILGVLLWTVADEFGLEVLPLVGGWADRPLSYWVAGIAGAVLMTGRARSLLWITGGLLCLLLLAAISTSQTMAAARGLVRRDALQPADAIYVLGGGIHDDGTPDDFFEERLIHGYELLGQGYAPRLVVPHLRVPRYGGPVPPYAPYVRRQMRELRLPYPVLQIGPVANTFEEASAVARLVHQQHWKRVIVVSSPTHMRRVAAVFTSAHVPILCSPCIEGHFDLSASGSVVDREGAFRSWLHEVIGYRVYKLRGRI